MSDHADTVREGFGHFFASGDEEEVVASALAALDALVAERDAALGTHQELASRLVDSQERVEKLENAVRGIANRAERYGRIADRLRNIADEALHDV